MKMIQSIYDIEELEAGGNIPLSYISVVRTQFEEWYESDHTDECLTEFRLPAESCIHHLEEEKDAKFILDQLIHVEYVETEEVQDCRYFRIGIMTDHQMNLVFFIEGTLSSRIEQWLQN
ncbi:hypothetical protein [Paenibacillus urinalis]|uniref:Uncharacterized protein n=1 Tax=Paenibacillus urinalis TaxID=521520 RepID=A0AAX3MXD9_9BACL|nr:hypothetical protein [Paenibacillus urinalis]WDH82265.1 hypothetical protein PUW23_22890 [Paenibacillus urinalis]